MSFISEDLKIEESLEDQYMSIFSRIFEEINRYSFLAVKEATITQGLIGMSKTGYPLDEFEIFSIESKTRLLVAVKRAESPKCVKAYLQILKKLELDEICLFNFHPKGGTGATFREEIRNVESFYSVSESSEDFSKLLIREYNKVGRKSNGSNGAFLGDTSIHLTSLILLSKYYGESNLKQILSKSLNDPTHVYVDTVEKLLEAWSELKDYPFEWSVELVKTKAK